MVGFDVEKDIVTGTEVLKHAETPGLGDKIDKKKDNFSTQFNGKNLAELNLKVKKEGGMLMLLLLQQSHRVLFVMLLTGDIKHIF